MGVKVSKGSIATVSFSTPQEIVINKDDDSITVWQGGTWNQRLQDGSGNAVTSQVNGAQRALDVGINVAGVQVDPRQGKPGALTDRSGTLTTTSSQIMAANPNRQYLFIQNNSGSILWIDFGVAATNAPPSIRLNNNDIFLMEGSFISTDAVNGRSGSGSQPFTAKEG